MYRRARRIVGLLLCWACSAASAAVPAPVPPQAAIASAHPLATAAGFETLEAGGNAFDAAVTLSATLAVVEPYSSGLGGGGFWLLHEASSGRQLMLDGRERAPLAAHRDMYLGDDGQFLRDLALDGALAAGIPGLPAALTHLAAGYGRLPLAASLAPAIRLAREGFAVDPLYRTMAEMRLDALRASPAAARQFLFDGGVPPVGHLLRQPDLAATLEAIAERGHGGFYQGRVAERLLRGVREAGGIWSAEDLSDYRILERPVITGDFQGWRLVSAAPPSSGGVLLAQMLNMLETRDPAEWQGPNRPHLLVEVMRRAYRDRARYLGDPDQVEIPLDRLLHPYYAAGLMRGYAADAATPSILKGSGEAPAEEGQDTTHFSILDRQGNRVAATLSINYPFGSGFVPPGTGVLLNDEMDDFSARPGVPNVYGLIGGEANAIAPGKRMLSSMSPTFFESEDAVVILGTPGGSRIITTVLQGLLGAVAGRPVADWVAAPRLHHQYLPDVVELEPGALDASEQARMRAMGHRLEILSRPIGNMQAIVWDRRANRVSAASDPRGVGQSLVR